MTWNPLPDTTARALKNAVEISRGCTTGAHVTLAVGYGGRQQVIDAFRALLNEHAEKGTTLAQVAETITVPDIARHLYTAGQPDPDLAAGGQLAGQFRAAPPRQWHAGHGGQRTGHGLARSAAVNTGGHRSASPVRGTRKSDAWGSRLREIPAHWSVVVIVDVYEAVRSRQSVRGFLDRPVPSDVLRRVLSAALQAPSGGNLQPWHVYVVSGAKLDDLKARVRRRVAAGDPGDQPPVPPYPLHLPDCYARRLDDMGARRYGAVGVAQHDQEGRARVRAGNWECWGATTAVLCYLDEVMLPPQWMDVGMFLQSVMLLFRAEEVDTCPQIAWAEYHETVAEVIEPPDNLVLACGMSVGYADPGLPRPEMPRALLSDAMTFTS